MNQAQFDETVQAAINRTANLLMVKGGEYANDTDRLGNFKRGSALTGCTPEQVLFIYLSKHYDAIATYIRDNSSGVQRTRSEPIQGRVDDCINYLFLLHGLLEDTDTKPKGEVNGQ